MIIELLKKQAHSIISFLLTRTTCKLSYKACVNEQTPNRKHFIITHSSNMVFFHIFTTLRRCLVCVSVFHVCLSSTSTWPNAAKSCVDSQRLSHVIIMKHDVQIAFETKRAVWTVKISRQICSKSKVKTRGSSHLHSNGCARNPETLCRNTAQTAISLFAMCFI